MTAGPQAANSLGGPRALNSSRGPESSDQRIEIVPGSSCLTAWCDRMRDRVTKSALYGSSFLNKYTYMRSSVQTSCSSMHASILRNVKERSQCHGRFSLY